MEILFLLVAFFMQVSKNGNEKETTNSYRNGVTEEPKTEKPTTESLEHVHPETSYSMNPVYIGASLGVIILALAIVLVIYFRQKRANSSTHRGKETGKTLTYATVTEEKLKSSGAPPSSGAQSQESNKGDSLNLPESLHYSTLNYNNHIENRRDYKQPTNLTYSTIKLIDASAVYCNV
ncbi:uncharacterized protein LOC133506687 isoform X2 [Syngnathoides biaculeatus]|uniref:uncharacterized protein LOC133506687 isoform X2 n=1 Tax=Syngnathoides biaculeatus TaxID=300417 RepID=UPI002ADDB10C|nr:uncharacterized protein LOC133506687 isoform X2 [Syngnathoides biaculeatus]